MAARPRSARWLSAVSLIGAFLLAACSIGPSEPAESSPPSVASSPGATTTPTPAGPGDLPKDGRPVQPVPSVRPDGLRRPAARDRSGSLPPPAVDWKPCGRPALRHGPGAAGLREAGRRRDHAGDGRRTVDRDPAAGLAVHQSRRAGRIWRRIRHGYFNDAGLAGLRHRRLGPARGRGVDPGELLRHRGSRPATSRWTPRRTTADDCWPASTPSRSSAGPAWSGLVRCWSTSPPRRRFGTSTCCADWWGTAKINYFGSSYGTRIGSLYAELYPDRVGRMVLDGAVNISAKPRGHPDRGLRARP